MLLKRFYLSPDDGAGKGPGAEEPKTFTQDEVDRILGDRLAKERTKMEKDWTAKVEAAKTEAQRMAAMTADEKAQHEREQQEKERKDREDALAKREAAIQLRELRAEALETLAGENLPKALADCLDYSSADACKASIKTIGKTFNNAVQAEVENRLKGKTPAGGMADADLSAAYTKKAEEARARGDFSAQAYYMRLAQTKQ